MDTARLPPYIVERLGRIREACAARRVKRLDVFGSVVGQAWSDMSDVDVIVEFERMAPREHAEAYVGLLAELGSILARPVDLVESNAIKNPVFYRAVERTRLALYAA